MKRILERINNRKIGKPEWIILFLLLVFPYLTECFYDILATYTHGYSLLRVTLRGEFFDFYDIAKIFMLENAPDDTLKNLWGAVYSLPIYIIFGLWSIPIALIRKITSIGLYDIGVILWYKMLVVAFAVASLQKMYRILKKAGLEKDTVLIACFLLASSLFYVLPIMFMAGYDVILVFFILWGIELYLENYNGYKWIVVFGIATTFKMFALFLFFPLLLYKEKSILSCIYKTLVAIIPLVFFSSLFWGSEVYLSVSSNFLPEFVKRILANTMPGGNSSIPIIIFLWIALCIWAYLQHQDYGYKEMLSYVSWMGLVSFSLILVFAYCHPQWVTILAPFIYITVGLNMHRIKINMILELFCTFSISLFYILHFDWVYCCGNSMKFCLLNTLGIHKSSSPSLAQVFHETFEYTYDSMIFALFAVTIIALIVINRPFRMETVEKDRKIASNVDYGMVIIRLFLVALIWIVDLLINMDMLF
ncbi:hypothetical protein SAMN02910368_01894 [Lachnospiraceae bacterium G11]|nr:hypothetical protein SAMN02910368_01894 [Lachnospiraceae bacterium G11]